MSSELVLIAIVLAAISGIPSLCLPRFSVWGQRIAAFLMTAASLTGLSGAWFGFNSAPRELFFPWPSMGNGLVGLDALGAFFLVPVLVMGCLGSIYGLGYWPQRRHHNTGRKLMLFWGLLVAGMALVVISRHAMVFLLAWEIMALSAFFMVTTDDHREDCRRAGWIYLIATHTGTLSLFALFSLWHWATGSYALQPVTGEVMGIGLMNAFFFLALFSFGLKAGIMPLHFWLPAAHTHAPSHVSAIMSGVIIKMGIYGLLRFLSLLPTPPASWGWLLLVLGAISGLLGVIFAIAQHDLKRLLAYHSIENIGIIMMGLGLAMMGRATGHVEWVVLGMAGCLLHVWNHAFFKALLFFCAGAVVHRAHTRQIDRLGGLAKTMPWTAALFLVGAVAICGLPPLNGFVSEWFVYLGLLRTVVADGAVASTIVIGIPVLAMIGALAVACFVKVYGAVFLGLPRDYHADDVREVSISMRLPMAVLALCCIFIGLVPIVISPLLDKVIACWMPNSTQPLPQLGALASLGTLSIIAPVLAGVLLALGIIMVWRGKRASGVGTWDCGYARPTSRMQYTAASFARTIISMFGWVLRPREHLPRLTKLFPSSADMDSHVDDAVLERLLMAGYTGKRWAGWFHRFQQGMTQQYVLYILIMVILMLCTLVPFKKIIAYWFAR